ncbi:restriction endonuclease subunit S [Clostridium tunisiense]|uniref:restriction endonuclease subunit S n=1 Tax=Clostridium tunisiense TaxID=219748 RepID=UPI0003104925|nr:restriction endonuclease subunit S [Clostridium tunisiense]
MIKRNNVYNKYKEIDVYGDIQKIPQGWQVIPNIAIFDERTSKDNLNEELISVTIGKGIIKQSELQNKKDISNEDKSNYKLVKQGDIAYNKMRMWQGAVGFSKYRGIVSPAYVVLKPKVKINPEYYHYLFRTNYYSNYAKRFSYGLCDDQLNLRYSDFKRMYSIMPPLETQDIIVRYLNKKSNQVNLFIEKQLSIIDILKEQKKGIVSRVITRGINENCNMKDSNIKWFGNIPEHWELRKLKFCVSLISEQTNKKEPDDIFISLERIESWTGLYNLKIGEDDFESSVKKFKPNDVLFGRLRPYLAKAVSPTEKGVCVGELLVLRPNKSILSNYLKYVLLSEQIITIIDSSTFGAKMPRASWDFIGQIEIPVPTLKEQEDIISYIEDRSEKTNYAINKIEKEIKLIKDCLESIVFNAVTGQIKVE